MGTSGSGRLSDYGVKSEIDKCDKIIENELLENCGDYDYFNNQMLPLEIGTKIFLKAEQRIVVFDLSTNSSIGALSTRYEYIRQCISRGYEFHGEISEINENNGLKNIYVTLIGTKAKK